MGIISAVITAVTTLVVGSLAYVIYRLQKLDTKQNIATAVFLEIERAQRVIKGYHDNQKFAFKSKIITLNSWEKNKSLFVKDFYHTEVDKISELYSSGEFLDDYIRKMSDDLSFGQDSRNLAFIRERDQCQTCSLLESNKDLKDLKERDDALWNSKNLTLKEISESCLSLDMCVIKEKFKKIAKIKP